MYKWRIERNIYRFSIYWRFLLSKYFQILILKSRLDFCSFICLFNLLLFRKQYKFFTVKHRTEPNILQNSNVRSVAADGVAFTRNNNKIFSRYIRNRNCSHGGISTIPSPKMLQKFWTLVCFHIITFATFCVSSTILKAIVASSFYA